MKKIAVIFKKELKDTLRDRRTVMMMVLMPFFLVYVFMDLAVYLSSSQTRKAEEKPLKVGLVMKGNSDDIRSLLEKQKNLAILENIETDRIDTLIREKKLDFALVFEDAFDQKIKERKSGRVDIYYKASVENNIAKRRVQTAFDEYAKKLMSLRLDELNRQYEGLALDSTFVAPLVFNEKDRSTRKEKVGESIGGLLPYFFILFCFLGAMYPAIDLGAGEKERATLETLLTSPASRMEIVVGKFLVITCTGIISALIAILGLYLSFKHVKGLPAGVMEGIIRMIEFKSIGLLLSLLVPLCVFFAAILLSLSIFARSFKEAQSIITPLNFMIIIPAFIGMFPGIKLSTTTALIPVLNVSQATKEIISGTIQTGLLMEV